MMATTETQVNNIRNEIAEKKLHLKALEKIQKDFQKRKNEIKKFGEKMEANCDKDKVGYVVWIFNHFELFENTKHYNEFNLENKLIHLLMYFQKLSAYKISISPHKRYNTKYIFTFKEYQELIQNIYPDLVFEYGDICSAIFRVFPLMISNDEDCNICSEKKPKADMVCFLKQEENKKIKSCSCKYDVCCDCATKIVGKKCHFCRTQFTLLQYK